MRRSGKRPKRLEIRSDMWLWEWLLVVIVLGKVLNASWRTISGLSIVLVCVNQLYILQCANSQHTTSLVSIPPLKHTTLLRTIPLSYTVPYTTLL